MSQLFNQFSFLFLSLGLLLALAALLRWRRAAWRWTLTGMLILALLLGGLWLVVRPGVSDVTEASTAEAILTNGRPTLLEFFSNYCLGCVSARPTVDALVDEIADRFNVLRIDIHTTQGRTLRERLGFSYTPEFVLFNAQGEEVWRSNQPPTAEHLALAAS
jgi:thiol-disulfide isomerase/thioredoxin